MKVLLVERKNTEKWLAEILGKIETTNYRWCTNETQPSLETLFAIINVLNVDVRELMVSTKSVTNFFDGKDQDCELLNRKINHDK